MRSTFIWEIPVEWINGYGDRFGLTYVDLKTQKRTPNLSAA